MRVILLFLLSLIGNIYCLQLSDKSYTTCDSSGSIQSLHIRPCSSEPCTLCRGTTVSAQANFIPLQNSTECKLEIKAFLFGWLTVSTEPVCGQSLSCPLKANSVNTLESEFAIGYDFPQIELLTEWTLKCDDGLNQVFCVEIDLVID